MELKNKEKLVALLLTLLIGIGAIYNYLKDKKLQKDMKLTCGQVTRISKIAHGNVTVFYSFYVDGIEKTNMSSWPQLLNTDTNVYLHKSFLVIYERTDVNNNQIILFKEYLRDYNVSNVNWNNCVDNAFQINE